jgi:hypothetical protein
MAGPLLRRLASTVVLALLAACVGATSIDGRRCPCADGYRCCERIQMCLPAGEIAGLHCAADDPDGRAPADTAVDAAAGDAPGEASVPGDSSPPAVDGAAAACRNGGGGVSATYFPNADLSPAMPPVTRVEPGLSLDWQDAVPAPGLPMDGWSALFGGELVPDASDDYTFFVEVDDAFRLWLGGELLLDWWKDLPTHTLAATVPLQAGRHYPLRVEYLDRGGRARLDVTWARPSTGRAAIPPCALIAGPALPAAGCPATATDCVPPGTAPCGSGRGLRATYHHEVDFTHVLHTEEGVGFTLDFGWLDPSERGKRAYSVRWDGFIDPPTTGDYTFALLADGYTTLFVRDKTAVANNDATTVRAEVTLTVHLVAGVRNLIRIEYTNRFTPQSGWLQLRWKGPSVPKGGIPPCRLFPPETPDGGTQ